MIAIVEHLVATYGYFGLAIVIGVESMGIPLPGEAALISAALYAGTTHQLSIVGVIAAAVAGAVIGDNIGYLMGRRLGLPILVRYGSKIGISQSKLKLGRYLFAHYGLAVVFFGRFVAVLRTLAAILAGINQMPWIPFFGANFLGAMVWAGVYGIAAYGLGRQVHKLAGPVGILLLMLAVMAATAIGILIRRNAQRLQREAEAEYPNPLQKKIMTAPSSRDRFA